MRITPSIIALSLWLVAAGASAGQQNAPPPEPDQNPGPLALPGLGQVDLGFRGTIFAENSDQALYQRYRDLRTGPFGENFRWGTSDDHVAWDVLATHIGYRDQQYAANYDNFGKLKASFEWNQIPLFFS